MNNWQTKDKTTNALPIEPIEQEFISVVALLFFTFTYPSNQPVKGQNRRQKSPIE